MFSLYDFGMGITKIREAADGIEVKGRSNSARIVYIIDKCNELINAINESSKALSKNSSGGQNGAENSNVESPTNKPIAEEEGGLNGEPDSGTVT